jgi:hypothetical protein
MPSWRTSPPAEVPHATLSAGSSRLPGPGWPAAAGSRQTLRPCRRIGSAAAPMSPSRMPSSPTTRYARRPSPCRMSPEVGEELRRGREIVEHRCPRAPRPDRDARDLPSLGVVRHAATPPTVRDDSSDASSPPLRARTSGLRAHGRDPCDGPAFPEKAVSRPARHRPRKMLETPELVICFHSCLERFPALQPVLGKGRLELSGPGFHLRFSLHDGQPVFQGVRWRVVGHARNLSLELTRRNAGGGGCGAPRGPGAPASSGVARAGLAASAAGGVRGGCGRVVLTTPGRVDHRRRYRRGAPPGYLSCGSQDPSPGDPDS